MSRTVVYTAVFGGYDFAPAPRLPRSARDIDRICFTDRPQDVPPGWRAVHVPLDGESPILLNRRLKILGHPVVDAYDTAIYVDGNLGLIRDPRPVVSPYLDRYGVAMPEHPARSCVFDEADACVRLGRSQAEPTRRLVERYGAAGLPRASGLTENAMVARRPGRPDVQALMEAWWEAFVQGPPRDQLHLPYVLWQSGRTVGRIPRDGIEHPPMFVRWPHRTSVRRERRALADHVARRFHTPIGAAMWSAWRISIRVRRTAKRLGRDE